MESPSITVANLLGTHESIPVDTNDETTVVIDNTFQKLKSEFEEQILHQPLSDCFLQAKAAICRLEEERVESMSSSSKTTKREDYLSWDDYFMSVATLSAMRSKDPSTQVGACIVDERRRIVGIGYNGFPRGCSDDDLPWARTAENELDTKYPVRWPYT